MHPAEAFPLSEYLLDEMRARGWSPADFARYSRCSEARMRAILSGDPPWLCEVLEMAKAIGCSATMLIDMEQTYRRWHDAQAL